MCIGPPLKGLAAQAGGGQTSEERDWKGCGCRVACDCDHPDGRDYGRAGRGAVRDGIRPADAHGSRTSCDGCQYRHVWRRNELDAVDTTTPSGLTTSAVKLTITTTGGLTALNPIALSSLTSGSWNTNKAQFVGTGGTTIVVGDRLLISTTTYPSGYGVQIADSQGILYAHALG